MRNRINRQLNIQRNVILILIVFFIFVFSTTLTYALYSRVVQDSVNIRFSNPVNVFIITNDQQKENSDNTTGTIEGVIFPGSQLNLKLGFQLGSLTDDKKVSSPAYVRVKINFTSDAVLNEDDTLLSSGLVKIMPKNAKGEDSINLNKWILVDFSENGDLSDLWWVYCFTEDENTLAQQVTNGITDNFLNGLIIVNTEIDNTFANKEIEIDFTVSAIQTMNIKNPLENITQLKDSSNNPVYVTNFYYSDALIPQTRIPVYTNATWGMLSNP